MTKAERCWMLFLGVLTWLLILGTVTGIWQHID